MSTSINASNVPLVVRHFPPLLIATGFTFGGLLPLWNAPYAMHQFGLPRRIQTISAAQSVFSVYSARVTAMGLALWTFYLRKDFVAVDTILATIGWIGAVEGYICWKEDVPQTAITRFALSVLFSAWGLLGLTSSFA